MQPAVMPTSDLDESDEDVLVHTCFAEQPQGLGLPQLLAETFADLVDWRQVAGFVEHDSALEIAR